jgi:hypothetical protein
MFVIGRFTRVRKGERTLMTEVAVIDTSQVSSIWLYPGAEGGQQIQFARADNNWRVTLGEISAPANAQSVRSLLAEIQSLKAEQLVSRDPERWEEYQVGDSLGTRIVVHEGSRMVLDMVAGRFQYQPPPQGSYNMYGQNRVTGKTYIRISGEDEVYSVDGFFALSVNQPFDRWRDNTLSRINKALVTKILFDYPADSGFVAQKTENGWMVAGLRADSASMETYLNRIRSVSHNDFMDGYRASGEPDYRLTMEGDNMPSVLVRAYLQEDSLVVLNSNLNPDTWFRTGYRELFSDLFPGLGKLLPEGS